MKKISIIVPIYNAEKYLKECLDSILSQTYKNIEVILIDDGSTDNSYNICQKYVEKYSIFILMKVKNGGVSRARNYGIKKSTGDYLTFVDSDDIIDSNFIEKMVSKINDKTQMVVCNYKNVYKNQSVYNNFDIQDYLPSIDAKKELFKDTSIRGFSCNKLFVTKIIKDNNILFDENIKICEDLLFCFNYLNYIDGIYIINEGLYNYRMRKSSASNKYNEKDLTIFDAFDKMYLIDNNIYEYSGDLYVYAYFKFLKALKKSGKINNVRQIKIMQMLKDKRISFKNKIMYLAFAYAPKWLLDILRKKKQDKYSYFE